MAPTQPRQSQQLLPGFALIALLLALLVGSGALMRLELNWFDQCSRWLLRESDVPSRAKVIVVGIDDDSRREFGVPVATLHRQIGQFLEAMADAKVRGVGLDVVLPESSYDRLQPGLDAAMARGILALRPVAPLVLGISADADGRLRPLHPLFAHLVGADGLGSVFVPRDSDGMARRFDERIGVDQQVVPSLAGQLARRLGATPGAGLVPMFKNQRISSVPLNQVLAWQREGDVARLQETFGGCVVLLGSQLAHEDQHRVPVPLAVADLDRGSDTTHGVFIHAIQLRSLLGNELIRELPGAVTVLVALLLANSWWLRPGRGSWAGTTLLTLALLAGSVLALFSGWFLPVIGWSMALLGGLGARTLLGAWQTAKERQRLHLAFDGSVSPVVLQEILAGRLNPQLAGERREVCVLFSDIRSFTTLSEHLPPETVTDLLNRYFERMAAAIHRHGGTLDKFIGDGIMAFFGAPQAADDPCLAAFRTARDMLAELEAFNREQLECDGPILTIGIGLHYGPAFIGYIGSKDRHDYSAIGDTVNTASRLEGLSKEAGHPLVMSDTVAERVGRSEVLHPLGQHAVKGRAAIEIFGWSPPRS